MTGIYKIQSQIKPERIYVGCALSFRKRWGLHRWDLKKQRHHSIKLQRHADKYGIDDLIFSVLYVCDVEELYEIEKDFIRFYGDDKTGLPYFNTCLTGRSQLGVKRSDEFIEKLKSRASVFNKGRKATLETRKKLSESHMGYKPSLETKEKLSKIQTGKKRSEETRKKMSEAKKGNHYAKGCKREPISDETREKKRNAMQGKPSPFKGKHHTEESNRKNRESHLGRKASPEAIEKREATKRGNRELKKVIQND